MFVTKVTDGKEKFVTGAVRGEQTGKPRYDLIGVHAQRREAELLARGAEHYGERNWEKGQNVARTLASLMRHVYAYQEGDRSEDHLAAIRFNAASIMHVEEEVLRGNLPAELLDIPWYKDIPGFGDAFTRPTPRESIVLDYMHELQAESYYVEWNIWKYLKLATLPSIGEQEFALVMNGLTEKGWVTPKVVEREVHPNYALTSAITFYPEFEEPSEYEDWDEGDGDDEPAL